MTNGTDLPVIIGAFVTIIGAFLGVAKIMLNQATKEREADRQERIKLSDAITLMAENSGKNAVNMGKVAEATERSAKEAAQRNGHLGEQNIQIANAVADLGDKILTLADRNLKAYQNVKEQKVEHQTVKHQE